MECQYGKRSEWHTVNLKLVGTRFTIEPRRRPKEAQDGAEARTGSLTGSTCSELKKPRKGHEFTFRLDLNKPDNTGTRKYTFSVESGDIKSGWMKAFREAAMMQPAGKEEDES